MRTARTIRPTGNSNSSDTITKVLANPTANADHAAIVTARAPWRILPVTFQQNGKDRAVVYIGLSLADQIDTVNTLTRYCIVVGIAVVLLGGSLSTLIIQHTMTPLKRIEKTAAKIAAGDLSQRIAFRAGKHRGRLPGRLAELHAHPNRIQFP